MERLKYIDTAKGYLMLLVVLGHVLIVLNPYYANLYYTAPQAFIYTFHMPLFLSYMESYLMWISGDADR